MMLSFSSPVMKAMFEADFKEKDAKEIELPGKTLDTFLDLMKAVHPFSQFKDENAERLVPLAHEYQMTHLMSLCEKFLLQDPPSLSRLVLADKYGLNKLSKVCIEYAKKTPVTTLQKEERYNQVDPASKVEILEQHIKELVSKEKQLSLDNERYTKDTEFYKERLKKIWKLSRGRPDVFQHCTQGQSIHRLGEGHCFSCKVYLLGNIEVAVPHDCLKGS